jgi:hypothetical protein
MERVGVAFECSKVAPERDEATSALVGVVEGGTGCSKGLRGDTAFEPADAESIVAVAGAASIPLPVLSVDDMDKSGTTGGVTSLPDPTEPLMLLLLQVVLESGGGIKSRGAFCEVECDEDTASGIGLLDKNNPCMCIAFVLDRCLLKKGRLTTHPWTRVCLASCCGVDRIARYGWQQRRSCGDDKSVGGLNESNNVGFIRRRPFNRLK